MDELGSTLDFYLGCSASERDTNRLFGLKFGVVRIFALQSLRKEAALL
jgi:hypothetical protein